MQEWWVTYGYGPRPIGPIGLLIIVVLVGLPFWKICTKAGYPGITSLLIYIPVLNVVFLYWLAFSDWPSLRKPGRPS
jgi:hypothetical protein